MIKINPDKIPGVHNQYTGHDVQSFNYASEINQGENVSMQTRLG